MLVPDIGCGHQHLGFPSATRGKAWQIFSRCAKCTQFPNARSVPFRGKSFQCTAWRSFLRAGKLKKFPKLECDITGPLSIVHYCWLVHILLPIPTHPSFPHLFNQPLSYTCYFAPSHLTTLISSCPVCPFLSVLRTRATHEARTFTGPGSRPPKPPRDANAYYC